jgi:hypothetical protein
MILIKVALNFLFIFFILLGKQGKKDKAMNDLKEKNERKQILNDLKYTLNNAVQSSKDSVDVHTFHVAYLEGTGRKASALKHILSHMKSTGNRSGGGRNNSGGNIDSNNNENKTNKLPVLIETGFQHLLISYLSKFRPKSTRKRLVIVVLSWVSKEPNHPYAMQLGITSYCYMFMYIRLREIPQSMNTCVHKFFTLWGY